MCSCVCEPRVRGRVLAVCTAGYEPRVRRRVDRLYGGVLAVRTARCELPAWRGTVRQGMCRVCGGALNTF